MTSRLILPGTGVWERFVADAVYAPCGGRVIAPPHFGIRGELVSNYKSLERRLLELTENPVELFCHSQGVVHGLHFAMAYPERVKRLILICPPPRRGSAAYTCLPGWAQKVVGVAAPILADMGRGSGYVDQLYDLAHHRFPSTVPVFEFHVGGDEFGREAYLRFPRTTSVRRVFIGLRRPANLPRNVTFLRSLAEHLTAAVHPHVHRYLARYPQPTSKAEVRYFGRAA